jgi:hypothetical protein
MLLLVALAVATRADAGGNYGASKFTITGTVLCQDCTKNWNAYAYNAKPVAGTFPLTDTDPRRRRAHEMIDGYTVNHSQAARWP